MAEQEAKRQFAISQAAVEQEKQRAEAAKIKAIKKAEAEKEQKVLAAEAFKQEKILLAEGERDAKIKLAEGVTALGEAEAEVIRLKREAMYSGESGVLRAKVEIETNKAKIYRNMLSGATVLTDKSIARLGETAGVSKTHVAITE